MLIRSATGAGKNYGLRRRLAAMMRRVCSIIESRNSGSFMRGSMDVTLKVPGRAAKGTSVVGAGGLTGVFVAERT